LIQGFLREYLAGVLPELRWTESYRSDDSNVGTVYAEGGSSPDEYDVPNRYPSYMVYISSPDWGLAQTAAEIAFEQLKNLKGVRVPVTFEKDDGEPVMTHVFWLWRTRMQGEPNDLGVQNGIRDFSINFDVLLTEMKEDETNGRTIKDSLRSR